MWTIVTYSPNWYSYARSCLVDSGDSDFSYNEFEEEDAFDGISKVLYNCKIHDSNIPSYEHRTIIISRDGVRYYDNDNYSGFAWIEACFPHLYDEDKDSREYLNNKVFYDTQINFLQKCFDKAEEMYKEKIEQDKIAQIKTNEEKRQEELRIKRQQLEKLKKELGE